MAIVVGSPIPVAGLDPLDKILTTVQMEWQARCRYPFATKSGAELYTLQWRLLCSYSMNFVSQMPGATYWKCITDNVTC